MSILAWIILGLIAGVIAKFLHPGPDPGGFFLTIVIGIVGALIGGFLSTGLGFGDVSGVNLPSLLIAVLGSLVLLILFRMMRRSD